MLWLAAILLAALVLRVFWVASVQPDPRDSRFEDTVWYFYTGRHLAAGHGYVVPGDAFCRFGGIGCDERPPTALWAPGYPLLLAGTFLLPGDDLVAARGLNVLAGLALVAGVYYLGSRLWNRRAGLLGAALVALFPSDIFFSSLVLTESLFVAMAVGFLCLSLAWTMPPDAPLVRVAALGLAAGALAMVRPEGIAFVGVTALVWLVLHRSWRNLLARLCLVALGILVFVVPWTVRNSMQLGWPVIGTTGLGQVLLQAHNPEAGGQPDFGAVHRLWGYYKVIPRPEREGRINNDAVKESISYALQNIPREFSLVPLRLAAFYRGDRGAIGWNQLEDGNGDRAISQVWAERWGIVSDAYYYAVIGVALFTLPFWLRRMRGQHLLLWGPLAAYSAMWAFLFVGEPRYHLPLLPIFALLAAIGLAAFSRLWWPEQAPATPR